MPRTGPTRKTGGAHSRGHFAVVGHLPGPLSGAERQQGLGTPGKLGVHHSHFSIDINKLRYSWAVALDATG